MRFMPIQNIEPNSTLLTLILDKSCRVFMPSDTVLTAGMLENLKRFSYRSVYIDDPLNTTYEPVLDEGFMLTSLKTIKSNFDFFSELFKSRQFERSSVDLFKDSTQRDIELSKLVDLSHDIVLTLNRRGPIPISTVIVKSDILYPAQHALGTGILAVSLGLRLNLSYIELKSLFIASIAIEIGNLNIPPEILTKRGRLTPEEFEIVKRHTTNCFYEIKSSSELHNLVKTISLEHHERLDGTGYPNGLDKNSIHRLTRIVSLCDAYDALTSDRNYRAAYPPYQALHILEQQVDKAYDAAIFAKLKEVVVAFPPGMCLTTADGVVCIKESEKNGKITFVNIEKKRVETVPIDAFKPLCINYRPLDLVDLK